MSRRTRERRLEATERWPNLQRLLQGCVDEHSQKRRRSVEAALDEAIAGWSQEALQAAAREWWDWNATRSWKSGGLDIFPDGFGAEYDFPEPQDARQFMNAVYDKLIVSVRAEAGKDWRPDANLADADH